METVMRLEDVFAKVFERPADSFTDASSQETVGDWTSLRNVVLLVEIEKTFGIRFSTAEMTAMRSMGDIRAALETKGVLVR
jgi:acyl carrier protein